MLFVSIVCDDSNVSVCVCVFSTLFESAIPLVRTEMLFTLSNANPPLHSAFLHSSPSLQTEAFLLHSHSEAAAHCTTYTHTRALSLSLFFSLSLGLPLLFTSDVVLSVIPPVDYLVIVIDDVFCNASIGSIKETKVK